MNCLVVAATAIEVRPFLDLLGDQSISAKIPGNRCADFRYRAYRYHLLLSRQLRIKRPDLVIQAGVGGCFDPAIPLGSVVAVKQEAIADQSEFPTEPASYII